MLPKIGSYLHMLLHRKDPVPKLFPTYDSLSESATCVTSTFASIMTLVNMSFEQIQPSPASSCLRLCFV